MKGEQLRDGGIVYADDELRIQKLGKEIQDKWYYVRLSNEPKARSATLSQFADEVKQKFFEIGYVVNVDTTAAFVSAGPPDIQIVQRVMYQEPDHDHVRWDLERDNRN